VTNSNGKVLWTKQAEPSHYRCINSPPTLDINEKFVFSGYTYANNDDTKGNSTRVLARSTYDGTLLWEKIFFLQ